MATKLSKPVTRLVDVGGVAVNVTLTENGLELKPKGRQLGVFMTYADVVREAFGRASRGPEPEQKVQKLFEELGLLN